MDRASHTCRSDCEGVHGLVLKAQSHASSTQDRRQPGTTAATRMGVGSGNLMISSHFKDAQVSMSFCLLSAAANPNAERREGEANFLYSYLPWVGKR